MLRTITLLLLCMAAAGATASNASTNPTQEMLVTTEWLAKNLQNPEVVVVHVGRNRELYDKEHIPGARFIGPELLTPERSGLLYEMPPAEELVRIFSGMGIGDTTRVVLYGDNMNLWAARAYVALEYIGRADKVAMLDGSVEKWKAEKRPLTKEVPQPKAAKLTPRLKPEVLVDIASVRDASYVAQQTPGAVALLDARPPDQYSGAMEGDDVKRPGHIPGARSLFWANLLASRENPVFKPAAEMRQAFAAAGATPDAKIITYCRVGIQASYLYFMAKYAGLNNVTMYDGSYTEWSAHPETQVARD